MSIRIKMVLYGEPGVGKSFFALHAPKPFFITTDDNYEWLKEFGAKEEDHVQVKSWARAKQVFEGSFDGYETIVIDLVEDLVKWCEYEYCEEKKIDHLSDLPYGKAYDITMNDVFKSLSKVINKDKNVILIMHSTTITEKNRRGVDVTKYVPTTRIREKILDLIEGKVRYFLRAYIKTEYDDNGNTVKKRYLSLVPQDNEYGIIRGVDENKIPHEIPLDFNTFIETLNIHLGEDLEQTKKEEPKPETPKRTRTVRPSVKTEEPTTVDADPIEVLIDEEEETAPLKEESSVEIINPPFNETPSQPQNQTQTQPTVELSREDKLRIFRERIQKQQTEKENN